MFKEIQRLTEIKSFILLDKTVFLSKANNVYNYLNGDSFDVLNTDETLQNLRSSDGNIFINTNYGTGYFIKNDMSICLNAPIQYICFPFFLSYERTEKGKNTLIKSLEDENFKNYIHNSSTIFTVINSKYIRWNFQSRIIEAFEFPAATPLWQFDLESLGEYVNDWGEKFPYEVEQFIGVLGSNLLVLLNQKELLALDIHSGKIRQRLQYVNSLEGNSVLAFDEKNKLKYYKTNYFVQEQKNIVYALFEDVLYEINLAQPTIITTAYGLKNEFDKYQINPYKVSSKTFYYDQKIYFLEQELGRFGILDLPTRSILYVSEPIAISGEGLGFDKLKEIQVAENKVYVLDKTNTLNIFEKE